MELKERQIEFARKVGLWLPWVFISGYRIRFGDAWRSTDPLKVPGTNVVISYQELLKANGRTKVSHSKHNDRLALDFILDEITSNDDYRPLGEKWEEFGGIWGGRFGIPKDQYSLKVGWDPGHIEWP